MLRGFVQDNYWLLIGGCAAFIAIVALLSFPLVWVCLAAVGGLVCLCGVLASMINYEFLWAVGFAVGCVACFFVGLMALAVMQEQAQWSRR